MLIADLADCPGAIPILARWHFAQWGRLTGADSYDAYVALLASS